MSRTMRILVPVLAVVACASAQTEAGGLPAGPRIENQIRVPDVAPPTVDEAAVERPSGAPSEHSAQHALDLYDAALADAKGDPVRARARFAEAAAAFDAIEARRPVSAEFSRAQGNAHFFGGDIGRAVLAYRRGLESSPGDARLTESLRVARKAVKTDAAPSTRTTLLESLAHWRRFVSPVLVAVVLVGSWCGFWGVLIVARVRRARVRPIAAAVLGLSWLVTGIALGTDAWRRMDASAVVIVEDAQALNGPSSEIYEPTFATPLSAGVEAEAIESRLGWTRLRLRSDGETWVRDEAVMPVRPKG